MNLGFIGTGSMGTILIEAFIQSGAVRAEHITASNRTKSKSEHLADKYPGLQTMSTNAETTRNCDIIFICVKPAEYVRVFQDIQDVVTPQQIVVSITSPVLIKHLEGQLPCKIAKVVPSITNYARSGATLCMYGSRMSDNDIRKLEMLLSQISTPLRIDEQYTRVSSDLSSCGPAFLCFFLNRFIQAAVEEIGIPQDEATRLASEMLHGTGKLLVSCGFTPETLQQRVTVPGGITAEGLQLLSDKMSGVFNQLIQVTHAKYNKELEKVEAALYGTGVE